MYISDKQQIRFHISLSHALYEVNLCHTRKDAFFSEVSLFKGLVLHLLSLIAAFHGASLPPLIVKHDQVLGERPTASLAPSSPQLSSPLLLGHKPPTPGFA